MYRVQYYSSSVEKKLTATIKEVVKHAGLLDFGTSNIIAPEYYCRMIP